MIYRRQGILGLGQIASSGGLVRKEQDGVRYCAAPQDKLEQGLAIMGSLASFLPLTDAEASEVASFLGIESPPSGTVKVVAPEAASNAPPLTSFFDQVRKDEDGVILVAISPQSSVMIPTKSLELLRQIDTCSSTTEGGGAMVLVEPPGGFVTIKYYWVYVGFSAIIIGGIALMTLRKPS